MPLSKIKQGVKCVPPAAGGGVSLVYGLLTGTGAAAPSVDAASSGGLSVARTSTGLYVITLPGLGGLDIGPVLATVEATTGVARHVAYQSKSESARTITLECTVHSATGGVTLSELATGEALSFVAFINER